MVTLTKQEHIQLVMDATYWRTQFDRRVARQAHHEQRYRRLFDRLNAESAQREALLIAELEHAQAKVRDLQQRVFGRKSERSKGANERQGSRVLDCAPRGQRPGTVGHGRKMLTHLPQRVENGQPAVHWCPGGGIFESTSIVEGIGLGRESGYGLIGGLRVGGVRPRTGSGRVRSPAPCSAA
jgi:hypothetical protein